MLSSIAWLWLSLASGILELRIQLAAPVATQRAADVTRTVTVLELSSKPGTLRRERRPELGADQLVIVVLDRDGEQIDWRSIADPRMRRVETADAAGALTGQVIVDPSAPFTLRVPDLPAAARIRLYRTETTDDGGYALAYVAELPLRR
jgi:hypothetical protein